MFKRKTLPGLAMVAIILSIVAIALSAFGAFAGRPIKGADTVGSNDWTIGAINDSGKIVESRRSIYTKDMMSVEDMEITLAEEHSVSYRVVFYDKEEAYLSSTEDLSADFDVENLPENAEYFRVIVTPDPIDDEPVEITFVNKAKYAKQLEIAYGK